MNEQREMELINAIGKVIRPYFEDFSLSNEIPNIIQQILNELYDRKFVQTPDGFVKDEPRFPPFGLGDGNFQDRH